MIGKIERAILENWEILGNQFQKPTNLEAILLSGVRYKKLHFARCVVLFFLPGGYNPFLVAKFYKDKRANIQTLNEFNMLAKLNQLSFPYVPRVKGVFTVDGRSILFEEWVEGNSMEKEMRDILFSGIGSIWVTTDILQSHLRVAQKIYTSLYSISRSPSTSTINEELDPYMATQPQIGLSNSLILPLITRLKKTLEANDNRQTLVNWDFSPQNIILHQHKIPKLIDWEFSSLSGLSFLQPMHVVHYYLKFFIDHKCLDGTFAEVFISLLHDKSDLAKIVQRYFLKVLGRVTHRQLRDFMAFFLLTEVSYQKKVLSFFPGDWEKYYVNTISELCVLRSHKRIILLQPQSIQQQRDWLLTKNHELQNQIERQKEQIDRLESLTKTRGWKVVSAIHRFRENVPVLKKI